MSDSTLPVDPNQSPEESLSDDALLTFVQRKRKEFVDELIKEGYPTDPKEQYVFLTALSDMDRTAINNKRIGAAQRQSAADALVARAISQISNTFTATSPFERESTSTRSPSVEVHLLPASKAVPGETDIGIVNEDYQTLVTKFDRKKD